MMIKVFKKIFLVPFVLVSIFSFWLFGYLYSHSKPILKANDINLSFDDSKIDYNVNLVNTSQGFFYDLIFNQSTPDIWYQSIGVQYSVGGYDYNITIRDTFYNNNYMDVFGDNYSIIDNEKISSIIIDYVFNNYNHTITISDINYCEYRMYISGFTAGLSNLYPYCYNINLPVYVYSNTTNNIASFQGEYLTFEWINSSSTQEQSNIVGGSFPNQDTNYILPGGLYFDFTFSDILNNNVGGTNFYFNFAYYDSEQYNLIINNLNSTIQDLQSQLRSFTTINQSQSLQITNLQNQIDSLQTVIFDLENDNSLKDDDISYLNSQIDTLNSEISLLRHQLELDNAEFSFTRLFWTIGSLPLESFKTFYDVSFLGINISDIFLGIIFLGLIIFLFRKFFGMFFNL